MSLLYTIERIVFSLIDAESTAYWYRKIFNLDTYLTPYAKVNSRRTINLNVIDKAIKLLEANMLEYLNKLCVGKDFLCWT